MLESTADVAAFLKERLAEPDVLLFAGAGVGKRVALPDWAEYLEALASFADKYESAIGTIMRSRGKAEQFAEAFQFLSMCSGMPPADRYTALAKPFIEPPPNPDSLLPLVRLPFRSIVTTNFDRSLLEAYVKVHGNAPRTAGPSDVPLQECPFMRDFYLARMHGKVEYCSAPC